MKLAIKDFAKIKSAEMVFDGITVIAGENNTGKSTVGKILFSLFNAMSDVENKIRNQRIEEIRVAIDSFIKTVFNTVNSDLSKFDFLSSIIAEDITDKIFKSIEQNKDIREYEIYSLVKNDIKSFFMEFDKEYDIENDNIRKTAEKVKEIIYLPKEKLIPEILSVYFGKVFNGQINSLTESETIANLNLTIKEKNISMSFEKNKCKEYNSEINILNKAIYLDNPFIIDNLGKEDEEDIIRNYLVGLLSNSPKQDILDGIIGTVLVKEKLAEVYKALQNVVDGNIIKEKTGEYFLQEKGISQPVSLKNLSTGIKSFVVVKMLLEKGSLKEKDVLILDEPEIHLHPQWQIAYAELIVLLQKYFDLTIVVTTHSPYFLDAINLYSIKYDLNKKVNYYLSSIEENHVNINCVTEKIDLIYKKMASPIQMLNSLRYDMNN